MRMQGTALFAFFAALGVKRIAAHGAKFARELKEPCAHELPQPFRTLRELMQDTPEKLPRNPQNGRWFARDRRRRTPCLRPAAQDRR